MAQLQSSAITGSLTLSGSLSPIIFPGTNSRIEMGDPSGTDYSMNFRTNRYYYFQDNKTLYISGPVNARNRISNDQGTLILGSKGTNIMYLSGSSVGIGTSSPTTKLHVTGITQIAESGNSAFYGGNYVRVFNDQNFNFRNVSGTTVANISVNGTSYFNGGNVGIGTTSPANKLHVTNGQLQIGDSTSNHFGIRLTRTNASVVQDAHLYSPSANSPSVFYMEGGYWTGENAGTVTAANSGYAYYERYFGNGANTSFKYFGFAKVANGNFTVNDMTASLTLKSDGNVGIGTTSPDTKLHVVTSGASKALNLYQASYQQFQFKYTDTYQSSFEFGSLGKLMYEGNGGYLILENKSTQAGSRIVFKASGSEYMRITHDGKVGIGTTSPSQRLHVSGNIVTENYYPTIYVNHQGTVLGGVRADATTKLEFKTLTTAPISLQVNSSQKMLITDSGNIGIGTNSPGTRLDVADSEPIIRLTDTRNLNVGDWDDVSLGRIQFYTSDTTSPGARALAEIQAYSGVGAASGPEAELRFKTSDINDSSAVDRMVIDAQGRVGIGTTSPGYNLDISGSFAANYNTYGYITLGNNLDLAANGHITIGNTSTDSVTIGAATGENRPTTIKGDPISFQATGATRMYISGSGQVGIGTTSPVELLDVDGTARAASMIVEGIAYAGTGFQHWGDGGTGVNFPANDRIDLDVASTTKIRITDDIDEGILINPASQGWSLGSYNNTSTYADIATIINGSTFGGLITGPNSGHLVVRIKNNDDDDSFAVVANSENSASAAPDKVLFRAKSTGQVEIPGDLTVEGIVTAQEFHTEFVSASIVYQSGSTKFGDDTGDNHSFTGSILLSGSYLQNGASDNSGKADFAVYTGEYPALSLVSNQVQIGSTDMNYVARFDYDATDVTIRSWEKDIKLITHGSSTTQAIKFYTANSGTTSEKMRITGAGNVGIGTTSPTTVLTIYQPADDSGIRVHGYDDKANSYAQLYVDSAGNTRLTQVNSGSSGYLQINAENYLSLDAPSLVYTTSNFRIYDAGQLSIGSGGDYKLKYDSSNDILNIHTDDNKGLTLDNVGRLGIGTTDPETHLHIHGTGSTASGYQYHLILGDDSAYGINRGAGLVFRGDYNSSGAQANFGAIRAGKSNANDGNANAYLAFLYGASGTLAEGMRIDYNGNVGIGTTAPQTRLHVSGSIRTHTTSTSRYIELTGGTTGNFIDTFGTTLYIRYGGDTSKSIVLNSGGNVGIGTSSPGSKLTVTGNIEASGSALVATNDAADSVGLSLVSPSSGVNVTFDFEVGDTGISNINPKNLVVKGSSGVSDIVFSPSTSYPGMMVLDGSTGRVGIGKTNPAYALDVSGSVRIATDNPLLILGDDENTVRYAATQYITAGGTWILSSGDSNTGTGTNASDLWITRATDGSNNRFRFYRDSYAFGVYSGSAAGVVLDADGTSYFNGGNVGIGTTSPSVPLEVKKGDTTQIISDRNGNGTNIVLKRSGVTRGVLATSNTSGGEFELYSSSDLVLNASSGNNVGIGKTSPTSKLDVAGAVRALGLGSYFGNSATSYSYAVIGAFSNGVDNIPLVAKGYSGQTADLTRWVDSSNNILNVVDASGNVGIGTTTPSQKLHVVGQIYGSGTIGNVGTNIGQQLELGSTAVTTLRFDSDAWRLYSGGSGGSAEILRVLETGNVGIGISNPASRLEVLTSTNEEGIALKDASANLKYKVRQFNGNTYSSFWNTSNSETVRIASAGNTYFNGGNVGIGTTSPGATLDISGSVKFQMYGQGDYTGTTAYRLAVDSSGNIIEESLGAGAVDGAGAANQVTVWSDSDTVSGSGDFTWDGTTLSINGTLEASEKSFNIKHPTKEDKRLIYGVLEGPEHAVYVRGKINTNVIELPEEWTGLVDEDTITVQLTSIGSHQNLYVVDIKDNKIFIKNGNTFSSKINAFYFVQGTRKDVKPLITERDAN